MKALVTGAAGFIGSHLAEALLKRGFDVTCLVRKTSRLKWIEHLDIRLITGELADPESYAGSIADFDFIFHIAGLTKAVSEKDFFEANAENTKKLLRVASEKLPHIKRFIFLSSLAAVGPGRDGAAVNENSPPAPVSFYGRSKLEGENAVLQYSHSMPVTILRPPAVYGPRDKDFGLLFRAIKKGIYPYWGKCSYSILYVADLVEGIILASERKEAVGETFFLSDGIFYTNEDITGEISAALGKRPLKLRIPRAIMPAVAYLSQKLDKKGIINTDRIKDFQYSNWTCNAGKAQTILGFRAKTSLQEGIKWTADWYRIHQWI